MNHHVNAISGRLSLRPPQRRSLEILDRITEISPLRKDTDIAAALEVIQSEFPSVTDFEREFPSLCFALATGVGKTRLMGAFISYLHLAHGINNFFVLAPNLTIYNKLITDFTPNTSKYVFKGIAAFAQDAPEIITGDNYEDKAGTLFDQVLRCKVNIFNISKINSEVRGGKAPRIKRLSEYIGESYFEYLAALPDLVLLMDESHRYRASAGVRAINELKPVIGLELTATPFLETNKGGIPFNNVIYDYALGKAMADGFVKEPAVVTRKNFNPKGMSKEILEQLKLEDGVRLHEQTKVLLETYARETNQKIVKPFVLVIARDITHAEQLLQLIESADFFEGRYKGKAIQVDSSKTGAKEEEMISRLLKVEDPNEPTEIVIHVNMLKEGWDVTNLYTIVPLRAANARILIEQSIGRGLRLPYGKRTGVKAVDRLNIVAHDKFQEIVDEANRPESAIHLETVLLDPDEIVKKTKTVVSQSGLAHQLGIQPEQLTSSSETAPHNETPTFTAPAEIAVAQATYKAIQQLESQPSKVPTTQYLKNDDIQAQLVEEVARKLRPSQMEMEGVAEQPDIQDIVKKATELVVKRTINVPRILVVPKGEVASGFHAFQLELSNLRFPPITEELWVQFLRTGETETVGLGKGGQKEKRLEDYVVRGLVDFDDINYDQHADLLYDLASQTVKHFLSYLSEEDARKVLSRHQQEIVNRIHTDMQAHYWEDDTVEYEVVISKGFTELKGSAYTASSNEPIMDYKVSPKDKSNMSKYLFGGFKRCLYPVQKFDAEGERILSVILDRETEKWFKPAKGQFQIFYNSGTDHPEYQPDFIAETQDAIYMLEPKASNKMCDVEVLAKKEAAEKWCQHASDYAARHGEKPWKYALISHDKIAENMSIEHLGSLQ
ncbi:MAG TPA: type III restriction endonuclease subunit R [Opitutae bacterium]|nr:type III restriction endonuclease subunit R [Puniceicoccaceae bacterium]HBR93063.1 type III restriction endonuclease subunit R [Opitutae bacterium]|tara:strand:- start:27612 stop:30293 length:2682 start_codon:yes stop_codon:yes gene_type:complete